MPLPCVREVHGGGALFEMGKIREFTGVKLDSLTIRPASALINHLKSMQPVDNGGGRQDARPVAVVLGASGP